MTKQNIVDQILNLTREGKIDWKNFKDHKPKYSMSEQEYRRLTVVTKFPKNVLPLRDGYNKYQSYYAYHNNLIMALTKGKRDSQLVFTIGEVTAKADIPSTGIKRRHFDASLTAVNDAQTHGKLTELFNLIHTNHPQSAPSQADVVDQIMDKL